MYETGKTTSRIALLKARIAELETQLRQSPTATPAPETNAAAHGGGSTINPATLGFAIPSVSGPILPISPAPSTHASLGATTHTASSTTGQSPRPPRVPHYAQSTNPRPPGPPDPHFDWDLSFLDQPVSDLNSHMYMAAVDGIAFGAARPRDFNSDGKDGGSRNLEDEFHFDANGDISILPTMPQGRELVGGWFDPTDVPPAVRDHLLDLFFARLIPRSNFSITIHMPRFYTRLTLPPAKRPHPALLYSMYATAARASSQPAIKQLEGQFFEIADKQIRLAVGNHDRLLDALRGMALLTNYLFAKEKYSLGYHMCGAAVRLAISCGLDRIPSSVWTPAPAFNAAIHCTLRTGGYAIPPPEDPIDLAERIYAL